MGSAIQAISNPGRTLSSINNVGGAMAGVGADMFDPAGIVHKSGDDGSRGPDAPGVDPNLARLRAQQEQNAKQFRANMPGMQKTMGENLKTDANQALSGSLKNINQGNSARGLLYSNINQGQKAGARAKAQSGVAKETANINTGLLNAANTLDAQAIQTGMGIQQTQQQLQDDIYSQAMARMNAQNMQQGAGMGLLAQAGMFAALA